MNILDWIVVILIAYITLTGIYRGFVHSAFSLGTFFFSWLCSVLFTPMVSRAFLNNRSIYAFIFNFTEGSERIVDFENSKLLISELSDNRLSELLTESNLPMPFGNLLEDNIYNKVFESAGQYTLGDYYNITISNVFINIIAFVTVFFVASMIFGFIINSFNYTLKFPVLKKYDTLIGSFFGLIRGVFITYALFMLTPLVLILVPLTEIYDILYDSLFASFFYTTNFMFGFIKGII
jgi:uncharacterized membrane protein required for colicin V production